jgi:tagatose 1,6-diphosphate aldolase GatY/KbaY
VVEGCRKKEYKQIKLKVEGLHLFVSFVHSKKENNRKENNMSIANAKEMMVEALKGKYAVGAFNVTDLLQFEAVIDAAIETKSPVIVQTSVKPSQFLGTSMMVAIYRQLAESAPVPVCLHLDHCTDIDYCKKCADAGYTNIMIDASKQSYEENIRQTKEVVDYCHKIGGISVEGELGTVSGVEDQIKVAEDEAQLANPQQSVEFCERTGVDIFAPAIGTAHGVYKTKNPKIDFERMATINQMLNGNGIKTPLVVHGGTGLPEDYIKKLLAAGGAKFNVSTELKHTLIDSKFEYINAHRDEYDPGKLDKFVRDATRKAVIHWMQMVESVGHA